MRAAQAADMRAAEAAADMRAAPEAATVAAPASSAARERVSGQPRAERGGRRQYDYCLT
jgi:hypothetical protein